MVGFEPTIASRLVPPDENRSYSSGCIVEALNRSGKQWKSTIMDRRFGGGSHDRSFLLMRPRSRYISLRTIASRETVRFLEME